MPRSQFFEETFNNAIRELNYNTAVLQAHITKMTSWLVSKQFIKVMSYQQWTRGTFSVMHLGEVEKPFCWILQPFWLRFAKPGTFWLLPAFLASCSMAGALHTLVLKLPLKLMSKEIPRCNISKSSSSGVVLWQYKLLVWNVLCCTSAQLRHWIAVSKTYRAICRWWEA